MYFAQSKIWYIEHYLSMHCHQFYVRDINIETQGKGKTIIICRGNGLAPADRTSPRCNHTTEFQKSIKIYGIHASSSKLAYLGYYGFC
jgi:hypothetical protein